MTRPRPVVVTAWARLDGERARAFRPRSELPQRKHLKLMDRAVRLGVAAVGRAVAARGDLDDVPAERRGLFVGTRPVGAMADLGPALDAVTGPDGVDQAAFGEVGMRLIHPLWLVKGLSNSIPGYACAYWDLRGPVANRCEGRAGGLAAIVEGARAVAEGRVDLAIAGGADAWPDRYEGAAMVVLEPAGDGPRLVGGAAAEADQCADVGAATGPLALVRRLEAGRDGRVAVRDDQVGLGAWVALGGRRDADGGVAKGSATFTPSVGSGGRGGGGGSPAG